MRANSSSARKARRSDGSWRWRQSLIGRCGGPRRCGGTSGAPPVSRARLSVFRSSKHIYAPGDRRRRKARRWRRPPRSRRPCVGQLKTGANIDARQGGGQAGRRAGGGEGHQGRRVRPRRLSLSRPRQGAGRGRARGRPRNSEHDTNGTAARTRWNNDMAREPRRRREREREREEQRIHRQARPHQSCGQGGEGRPPLRLRRARGRRRREGPRRLRPRQGARGAGGDPQGDRGRQAQPRSACRCARAARCITTCTGRHGAGKVYPARGAAGTGIIAGGPMRAVFETLGMQDVVAKSLGSSIPTTWCGRPSTRSSARTRRARLRARRNIKVSALQARRAIPARRAGGRLNDSEAGGDRHEQECRQDQSRSSRPAARSAATTASGRR